MKIRAIVPGQYEGVITKAALWVVSVVIWAALVIAGLNGYLSIGVANDKAEQFPVCTPGTIFVSGSSDAQYQCSSDGSAWEVRR